MHTHAHATEDNDGNNATHASARAPYTGATLYNAFREKINTFIKICTPGGGLKNMQHQGKPQSAGRRANFWVADEGH